MAKKILITGGTGLVGNMLTKKLQDQGYEVSIMTRSPEKVKHLKAFYWDIKKQEIDEKCLDGIDTIIHLAGENIADGRWTDDRKKALISSRTESIGLIYDLMKRKEHQVKRVLSASAVGFYGDRGEEILDETSKPGTGFLAYCCEEWEKAVEQGTEMGLRVAKFRIGLLLTPKGGVLDIFKLMVKSFTATKLGSGEQWFPWIHSDDLIGMFLWAVQNDDAKGVYNATAPNPVRNKEFTKTLSDVLHRPFWPFSIPKAMFKLLMGEKSELVLMSTHTKADKIITAGYTFKFLSLKNALEDLTKK
ncbi:MAG: TIGR01777 family oxidoreductase [Flavobacterium sp.]